MKKSIISTISISAILTACLALASCADTTTQTTYSSAPGEPPVESTTTTTYTTTSDQPDSVVGSTAHAAGTIIAAPFRIVGDALSVIF
jgi:ABC-type oligopeptide transport system substrate-binding subunit